MLIKVCGITTPDQALMALAAGADWIGVNLVSGPRRVDPASALRIVEVMPDRGCAVALISLESPCYAQAISSLRTSGVRRLQLYGPVRAALIASLLDEGWQPMYVQRVGGQSWIETLELFRASCGLRPPSYLLLDSHVPGRQGGTGVVADWDAIAAAQRPEWPPVLIAGGLTAANVGECLRRTNPFGVDVSSGVETAPGRKDEKKIREFVAAVRRSSPGAGL